MSATDTTSSGGTVTYSPEITAGTGKAGLVIKHFSNSFYTNDKVNAQFMGNIIIIPLQTPDAGGYSVAGQGVYNPATKSIYWQYVMTSPKRSAIDLYRRLEVMYNIINKDPALLI